MSSFLVPLICSAGLLLGAVVFLVEAGRAWQRYDGCHHDFPGVPNGKYTLYEDHVKKEIVVESKGGAITRTFKLVEDGQ